jgi:hypothetical protein
MDRCEYHRSLLLRNDLDQLTIYYMHARVRTSEIHADCILQKLIFLLSSYCLYSWVFHHLRDLAIEDWSHVVFPMADTSSTERYSDPLDDPMSNLSLVKKRTSPREGEHKSDGYSVVNQNL